MVRFGLRPGWSMRSVGTRALHFFDEDRELVVRAESSLLPLAEALTRTDPLPGSAQAIVGALQGHGVVVEHDVERDRSSRASRQLEYFDAFCDESNTLQDRVESARLLIVGLGGTGTEFLRHMVAVGVRNYFLVDQDIIEESNLNRQTIYSYSDMGRPKVDVAERYVRERVRAAECGVLRARVGPDADFLDLLSSFSPTLVFVAVDEPVTTIGRDLATLMEGAGHPYLLAGVGIRYGRVHAVSAAPATSVPVHGTRASLATTNAMVAARSAHTAVEFLTGRAFPFELIDG